jgi:hypothetical protein
VGTYLVDRIDKGLGVIPREVSDQLDLIMVRENGRYQRYAFIYGKGVVDQSFPGWRITVHKYAAKLTKGLSPE